MSIVQRALVAAFCVGLAAANPVRAQTQEHEACPGFVASLKSLVQPAALSRGEVSLTFVGHATFLIESPGGVRAATDYNDYVRPSVVPDVATMNRAHSTHYSTRPDPTIKHLLPGWNPAGGPARHDVTIGDVRVRNVSTNIRDLVGRRHPIRYELDVRVRDGGAVHRPSRPSAPHARTLASEEARAHRRRPGACRRRLHARY